MLIMQPPKHTFNIVLAHCTLWAKIQKSAIYGAVLFASDDKINVFMKKNLLEKPMEGSPAE